MTSVESNSLLPINSKPQRGRRKLQSNNAETRRIKTRSQSAESKSLTPPNNKPQRGRRKLQSNNTETRIIKTRSQSAESNSLIAPNNRYQNPFQTSVRSQNKSQRKSRSLTRRIHTRSQRVEPTASSIEYETDNHKQHITTNTSNNSSWNLSSTMSSTFNGSQSENQYSTTSSMDSKELVNSSNCFNLSNKSSLDISLKSHSHNLQCDDFNGLSTTNIFHSTLHSDSCEAFSGFSNRITDCNGCDKSSTINFQSHENSLITNSLSELLSTSSNVYGLKNISDQQSNALCGRYTLRTRSRSNLLQDPVTRRTRVQSNSNNNVEVLPTNSSQPDNTETKNSFLNDSKVNSDGLSEMRSKNHDSCPKKITKIKHSIYELKGAISKNDFVNDITTNSRTNCSDLKNPSDAIEMRDLYVSLTKENSFNPIENNCNINLSNHDTSSKSSPGKLGDSVQNQNDVCCNKKDLQNRQQEQSDTKSRKTKKSVYFCDPINTERLTVNSLYRPEVCTASRSRNSKRYLTKERNNDDNSSKVKGSLSKKSGIAFNDVDNIIQISLNESNGTTHIPPGKWRRSILKMKRSTIFLRGKQTAM